VNVYSHVVYGIWKLFQVVGQWKLEGNTDPMRLIGV